jgi:hypothetical protein
MIKLELRMRDVYYGHIAFLLLLFLSACTPQLPKMNAQLNSLQEHVVPPGTILQVVKPDGEKVNFQLDDIKKLKTVNLKIGSKNYKGPNVYTLLQATGIEGFNIITFVGKTDHISLKSGKLNEAVFIDIDQRNHLRLICESYPQEQWIDEIRTIIVE